VEAILSDVSDHIAVYINLFGLVYFSGPS